MLTEKNGRTPTIYFDDESADIRKMRPVSNGGQSVLTNNHINFRFKIPYKERLSSGTSFLTNEIVVVAVSCRRLLVTASLRIIGNDIQGHIKAGVIPSIRCKASRET